MARPLPRLGGPSLDTGSNAAGSAGVTLTAAATAHVKGVWTELVASTSGDTAWLLVQSSPLATGKEYLFDIGIGASTAEAVLIPDLYCNIQTTTSAFVREYLIPINVAAGTRLSARCQSSVISGTMVAAVQTLAPGGDGVSGCSRIEAAGIVSASTGLTLLAVGAVAHTDTAFSAGQLIASTGFDYRWLNVAITHEKNTAASAAQWLVDIGIGASGSETVLINDLYCNAHTGSDMGATTLCFPVAIAAGTRIAARARCDITTASDREVSIAVWGSG